MKLKLEILASIKLRTKENPVFSHHLETSYGLSGTEIRDIVRELRREGYPIANSKSGYYFANNYEEIEPTINDLESRAFSMLETVKKLKLNFSRPQQSTLF